ncbi:hypothetical protein, partial [Actinoplanes sp. NPDC026623]|uniref:hypothetical protein n=1 Tax=Actinoplanes sp. NPDC026623 TaxID=3155610 RepID=UPI0033EB73CA
QMRPQHSQLHRQGILTHHTKPNEPIMKTADQPIHRRALKLATETTIGTQSVRTVAVVAALIEPYGGGTTWPSAPLHYGT